MAILILTVISSIAMQGSSKVYVIMKIPFHKLFPSPQGLCLLHRLNLSQTHPHHFWKVGSYRRSFAGRSEGARFGRGLDGKTSSETAGEIGTRYTVLSFTTDAVLRSAIVAGSEGFLIWMLSCNRSSSWRGRRSSSWAMGIMRSIPS